ncbi:MAG TPA: SRPBCC domain-containing protein, partial [Dongiaceae bacterium]|nr:SRPBCC domain-containing protein [Dongiaceae bacterium]
VSCELDLRPGGIFRTVMRSPEGQEVTHLGCYLEVVRKERLVWTNALGPTFRPAATPTGIPAFTALIAFESHGRGTRYTALVMHKDSESRARHEAMGFQDGWGKALDQLVAAAKRT